MTMPTDSRRLPAPDISYNAKLFTEIEKLSLLDDEEKRADGRYVTQPRDVFLQCGVITQAKGSAYFEMNKTKVICSVYGPKDIEMREEFQINKGKLKCELKYAPYSSPKHGDHIPGASDVEKSDILLEAISSGVCLQRYPKSQIDVYVIVLEDDGSVMPAAITAASVALVDAGIEMYDVITASSIRIAGQDTFIIDPTSSEEFSPLNLEKSNDLNQGMVMVALLPSINQVSSVVSSGHLECNVLQEAIRSCRYSAQNLHSIVRKCLVNSLKKILKQRNTAK
uniref:Exoribonuclease phosphorolytic domain-containing protein n=1 Tax=Ciona intestinalis TaxID=7719 RepID=F6V2B2_CIOIN